MAKRGRDDDGDRRVGVVGLGRLGLCQALTLERVGYDVLGCDVFPAYVDSINNKTLQSDEPDVVSLLRASTKLRATLSLEAVVDHSDLVMVVVATPTPRTDVGKSSAESMLGNGPSDMPKKTPNKVTAIVAPNAESAVADAPLDAPTVAARSARHAARGGTKALSIHRRPLRSIRYVARSTEGILGK